MSNGPTEPAAAEQPEGHSRERPMKPKRRVISVRWRRSFGWVVNDGSVAALRSPYKAPAVDEARLIAREHRAAGGLAQVRVYGKDGRIQTEWTYGRRHRG